MKAIQSLTNLLTGVRFTCKSFDFAPIERGVDRVAIDDETGDYLLLDYANGRAIRIHADKMLEFMCGKAINQNGITIKLVIKSTKK